MPLNHFFHIHLISSISLFFTCTTRYISFFSECNCKLHLLCFDTWFDFLLISCDTIWFGPSNAFINQSIRSWVLNTKNQSRLNLFYNLPMPLFVQQSGINRLIDWIKFIRRCLIWNVHANVVRILFVIEYWKLPTQFSYYNLTKIFTQNVNRMFHSCWKQMSDNKPSIVAEFWQHVPMRW